MCIRDRSNAKTIRVNQEERPLGIVQGMYKKLDKFTVEYVIDSIKPVSYTHLDVYKRQMSERTKEIFEI